MELVEQSFKGMFKPYVRRTDWNKRPFPRPLESFDAIEFDKNNQTILCRVKIEEPSDMGLLIRKNDTLLFTAVEKFDYLSLFKNNSLDILVEYQLQKSAGIRVDMIFDWTLSYMQQLRTAGTVWFWLCIGLVLVLWFA